MKKALVTLLSAAMLISLTGCGSENSTSPISGTGSITISASDTSFSTKDAIKIEDIEWNVTESVMDGERFVSFNYTNNSKYTILDVEMKFVQK